MCHFTRWLAPDYYAAAATSQSWLRLQVPRTSLNAPLPASFLRSAMELPHHRSLSGTTVKGTTTFRAWVQYLSSRFSPMLHLHVFPDLNWARYRCVVFLSGICLAIFPPINLVNEMASCASLSTEARLNRSQIPSGGCIKVISNKICHLFSRLKVVDLP